MKFLVRINISASQLLFEAGRKRKRSYGKRYFGALPEYESQKAPSPTPKPDFFSEQSETGTLELENGRFCLRYEEKEQSDMAGSQVTLSFSEKQRDKLYMRRSGAYSANMIFAVGKRHSFRYDTGLAPITVNTYTRAVENTLSLEGGAIRLEYKTEVGGILQINRLSVEVSRI